MLIDPLPLQIADGDVVFELAFNEGAKTIRVLNAATIGTAGNVVDGKLTISHDRNVKTGRMRSVLRVDLIHKNDSIVADLVETSSAYLVVDRPMPSRLDSAQVQAARCIAMIASFFATDPAAATPSSVPLAISTSNGVKFLGGQP